MIYHAIFTHNFKDIVFNFNSDFNILAFSVFCYKNKVIINRLCSLWTMACLSFCNLTPISTLRNSCFLFSVVHSFIFLCFLEKLSVPANVKCFRKIYNRSPNICNSVISNIRRRNQVTVESNLRELKRPVALILQNIYPVNHTRPRIIFQKDVFVPPSNYDMIIVIVGQVFLSAIVAVRIVIDGEYVLRNDALVL